jgi:hypothetical protein
MIRIQIPNGDTRISISFDYAFFQYFSFLFFQRVYVFHVTASRSADGVESVTRWPPVGRGRNYRNRSIDIVLSTGSIASETSCRREIERKQSRRQRERRSTFDGPPLPTGQRFPHGSDYRSGHRVNTAPSVARTAINSNPSSSSVWLSRRQISRLRSRRALHGTRSDGPSDGFRDPILIYGLFAILIKGTQGEHGLEAHLYPQIYFFNVFKRVFKKKKINS